MRRAKRRSFQRVQEMRLGEIAGLRCNGDVEVMFLDESHFSTDPVCGSTVGASEDNLMFSLPTADKTRELHDIWGIRSGKRWFLLEEFC